jgi:hypothetical protein
VVLTRYLRDEHEHENEKSSVEIARSHRHGTHAYRRASGCSEQAVQYNIIFIGYSASIAMPVYEELFSELFVHRSDSSFEELLQTTLDLRPLFGSLLQLHIISDPAR